MVPGAGKRPPPAPRLPDPGRELPWGPVGTSRARLSGSALEGPTARAALRMRSNDATPSRSARGQAAFQLWLALVLVGSFVGSLWLGSGPRSVPLWVRVYAYLALVSSVATLALAPGALFWVAERGAGARWRAAGWAQAGIGALFLGVLYTDTVLYRLLGHHIDGAVLNALSTRGSGDAVQLGAKVWWVTAIGLVVLTLAAHFVWRLALERARAREARGDVPAAWLRPRVVALVIFLPLVFLEKSVYAAADIARDRAVQDACRPLPLRPVRVARLLEGDAPQVWPEHVVPDEAALAWPLDRPRLAPDGPRPDVFVLVIDSWRRDTFTPENTPQVARFAQRARVFENHLSGGNGTRFGLFSMLYGLHGSYWFPALAERRGPVLLQVLAEAGYEIRVFSSASMNFPEFRDTAWADVPAAVHDTFPGRLSSERDEQVAQAVEGWLGERAATGEERPFFCFVLLDSPHQPYHNPGGPYAPAVESLDYMELAASDDAGLPERVFNRYRNSVVLADRVAGELFAALDSCGRLDETLVVVTSDHGEEFQECGFWGHTSNFAPPQLEVPFLMAGPGVPPGRETRPTSHLDLAVTLLELLGASPAERPLYTLGESLLDPRAERERVVASWGHVGLWTESGIFSISLDDSELEVFDRAWRRAADPEACRRREGPALERLVDECCRYLRPR